MEKYLLFFVCALCFSCTNDDLISDNQIDFEGVSSKSESERMIDFNSSQDLENAINAGEDPTRSVVSKFNVGDEFVSLLDVITPSSELWNNFSKDEQDTILANQLTYYEAFGYDELVPNENFARFLNYKGEVLVDDSIYRITPIGTLCVDPLYYKDMDDCYNQLLVSNDSVSFNNNDYIRLSPTVILYNSFASTNKDISNLETRSGSKVPLKYYTTSSNGWVWSQLANIFGDRSTKHYEYIDGKRINGSLYDYNYGVYHELGVVVSASRKRGGFFSFINGWKDIKADELDITCKNMIFKLDYKTPSTIQFPSGFTFVSNSNTISSAFSDSKLKTLDIYGLNVSYKDIAQIAKLGFKALSNRINHSVSADTKVIRVATPNVLYTIIPEYQMSQKNINQIRKVFRSGVNFYISTNFLKGISASSIKELFQGLMNMPVQHLESGRAVLTSKIDGKWGGIVIDKNYDGNLENIYK